MDTIAYTNLVDKSSWGEGPWTSEPDKLQWPDPATNFPCLIVRGPVGALCGYVGVSPDHPLYGKPYNAPEVQEVQIHGGLTFAGGCQPPHSSAHFICHVPTPGEPDDVWWFGFDCAHCGDGVPVFTLIDSRIGLWEASREVSTYRTLSYVQTEVTSLAAQLKVLSP